MRCPVCNDGRLEPLDLRATASDGVKVEEYRCNRCPYITEVYR